MARSPARMPLRPLVWLVVPFIGLAELGFHFYFSTRAPRKSDWSSLSAALPRIWRPGDLVVVAPEWAEPLARTELGQEIMPLADLARADETGYAHAVEVSFGGQHSPAVASFRELTSEKSGPFTLRRLENTAFVPVRFAFLDHVAPEQLFVVEWNGEAERTCDFTRNAIPTAGGLGGHLAYPAERFQCSGGESFFVGVTVIDDEGYRPRRCIFAHPLINSVLRLRFPGVPIASKIRGSAGESYLLARDGTGSPVELSAYVNGKQIGHTAFTAERGFSRFEFSTKELGVAQGEVIFDIASQNPAAHEFCFVAEVR